uniref:Uncharacterized protein n=1 Tax=Branchiostoma floridae TaxID=7739 RepID=C3ZUM6_BRAFL|eukprot:XP_002587727.1 hypothetical protein BRAFLDRAFT_94630 [Branchiostoma floridae]
MKEFGPKLALIEGKLDKLDTIERKLDWLTDKVKKPKRHAKVAPPSAPGAGRGDLQLESPSGSRGLIGSAALGGAIRGALTFVNEPELREIGASPTQHPIEPRSFTDMDRNLETQSTHSQESQDSPGTSSSAATQPSSQPMGPVAGYEQHPPRPSGQDQWRDTSSIRPTPRARTSGGTRAAPAPPLGPAPVAGHEQHPPHPPGQDQWRDTSSTRPTPRARTSGGTRAAPAPPLGPGPVAGHEQHLAGPILIRSDSGNETVDKNNLAAFMSNKTAYKSNEKADGSEAAERSNEKADKSKTANRQTADSTTKISQMVIMTYEQGEDDMPHLSASSMGEQDFSSVKGYQNLLITGYQTTPAPPPTFNLPSCSHLDRETLCNTLSGMGVETVDFSDGEEMTDPQLRTAIDSTVAFLTSASEMSNSEMSNSKMSDDDSPKKANMRATKTRRVGLEVRTRVVPKTPKKSMAMTSDQASDANFWDDDSDDVGDNDSITVIPPSSPQDSLTTDNLDSTNLMQLPPTPEEHQNTINDHDSDHDSVIIIDDTSEDMEDDGAEENRERPSTVAPAYQTVEEGRGQLVQKDVERLWAQLLGIEQQLQERRRNTNDQSERRPGCLSQPNP